MIDDIVRAISQFFYFPLELLSAILIFVLPLNARRRYLKRLLFSALILIVIVIFIGTAQALSPDLIDSYQFDADNMAIQVFSTVCWCSILFLAVLFILWFRSGIPFGEILYCVSCAYLMEHMAYCLRVLMESFVTGPDSGTGTWIHFVCHAAVYLAVYFLFVRNMVHDGHYVTTAMNSVRITLLTLVVVIGMSVAATAFDFEPLHAVYAILCCMLLLFGQLRQQRQITLQSELDVQQQLWLRHKAQYELAKENIDIINQKCHDLKHQVAALQQISDSAQRQQVIASIQDSVMIYDSMLDTGNEILDTVLTEKSLLCREKGITLNCIAQGDLLSEMDAVDLYTLFGNALDNAIEANEKLPSDERYIDLQVRLKAGLIFIVFSNRYAGELNLTDSLPQTSKEHNGYHGFGLRSIRTIAEKYGGFMTVSAENRVFSLKIVIPSER